MMAAHFEGLGYMEQYEYAEAVEAFREVHRRAPGWIPGSINLAIALLNDSGREGRGSQESRRRRGHRAISTRPWRCSPACWNETRTIRTPIFAGASSSNSRGALARRTGTSSA